MPRHNRRRTGDTDAETAARPRSAVGEQVESWRGEDYLVRFLAGTSSGGPYRCPGCDQEIAPFTAHVVAWPAHQAEADDRRHWHTPCWRSRDRRSPGILRGRGTPKY